MVGAFIASADYVNAQRERARLIAQVADVMKTADVRRDGARLRHA